MGKGYSMFKVRLERVDNASVMRTVLVVVVDEQSVLTTIDRYYRLDMWRVISVQSINREYDTMMLEQGVGYLFDGGHDDGRAC